MSLEPGTTVSDRYKILAPLGEGGMGAVYQAEHVYMKKIVALKVLHASVAGDADVVARFEREAVAAGSIQHPNVAAATDFGRLPDGTFFLVLEYIDGTNLRAEIDKGPVDQHRALRIMRKVVEGVAAAHEKGIVHRDLKPENVMLLDGEGERVKVLDFGIAKIETTAAASDPNKILTQTGQVFGTPDYMSPEQAMGEVVDKRTDYYSLGVILFEMLAGTRPFSGDTMALLRDRVINERPPALPLDLPVDENVRALVEKLMARLANDRFLSAEDILVAIDQASFERSPTLPPGLTPIPMTDSVRQASVAPTARVDAVSLELQGLPRPTSPGLASLSGRTRAIIGGVGVAVVLALLFLVFGGSSGTHGTITATPSANGSASSDVAATDPSLNEGDLKELPTPNARVDGAGDSKDDKTSRDKNAARTKDAREKDPKKKGRKTGPGGIYIPPPDQWFK